MLAAFQAKVACCDQFINHKQASNIDRRTIKTLQMYEVSTPRQLPNGSEGTLSQISEAQEGLFEVK